MARVEIPTGQIDSTNRIKMVIGSLDVLLNACFEANSKEEPDKSLLIRRFDQYVADLGTFQRSSHQKNKKMVVPFFDVPGGYNGEQFMADLKRDEIFVGTQKWH